MRMRIAVPMQTLRRQNEHQPSRASNNSAMVQGAAVAVAFQG